MMVTLLLLLLPLQEPSTTADPSEPPPPVVELAKPAASTTTTAPEKEAEKKAAPAADAPAATPRPDEKPQGWDTLPAAAAQMGAGTGACCVAGCVALPFAFIPIPIVNGILANVVSGVIIGGTEAVVGDAVSQKRSAAIWPVLASSAILIAGGLVNVALSTQIVLDLNDPLATITSPAYAGILAVSLASTAAAIIVPAFAYHLMGVEKEPGDTGGLGVPGIVTPADPTGTRAKKEEPKKKQAPAADAPPPPPADDAPPPF